MIGIDKNGQYHFLDIFGIDSSRGLLFGWLRIDENGRERFSAFVVSNHDNSEDAETQKDESSLLPPFKKIKIEKIGFPRFIPAPPLEEQLRLVPVKCLQREVEDSPNHVGEFIIYLSSTHQ